MSEHHPEKIAVVACDLDSADLSDELVDQLLAGASTPEEISGPDGLLARLTKRLVERAMDAELSGHLGYEPGQAPPGGVGNARNGRTPKTIHTEHGSVRIAQPRDRNSSFQPQIVRKHQRRFEGFDDSSVFPPAAGTQPAALRPHRLHKESDRPRENAPAWSESRATFAGSGALIPVRPSSVLDIGSRTWPPHEGRPKGRPLLSAGIREWRRSVNLLAGVGGAAGPNLDSIL
jgi:hypothetical protein